MSSEQSEKPEQATAERDVNENIGDRELMEGESEKNTVL
jgi:hypothetical protein